jgi:diguanylate cyclase (GGDEF)-like protein
VRVRKQLIAIVSVAVVLALGLGATTVVVTTQSREVSRAQVKVHAIQKRVTDLLALTHEFTNYSEIRAEQQWRKNHAALLDLLTGGTNELNPFATKVLDQAKPIADLFQQIVNVRSSTSDLRDRQVNLLVVQLTTGVQGISETVIQWANALDESDKQTQRRYYTVVLSIFVLMFAIVAVMSALLISRVLRPLGKMQQAVRAVANGDISVRSATGTADEFGELSQAFDKMAVDLVRTLREEIAERKQMEEQVREMAFSDPLTGLPNRRMLVDRLEQAMVTACRHGHQDALLFIDLDNFKSINDTLGHDKGDAVLREIAARLTRCVREGDTVARLGGDEFVVLLQAFGGMPQEVAKQVQVVAEKILNVLGQNYDLDGHGQHSSASIGVTLFGGLPSESIEEPLKRAELAMYQAKAAGRSTMRFYEPEMQATVNLRATLEAELRQAVTSGQFVLHYQPQSAGEVRLSGVEALLRWQHPRRGLVWPDEFIAVAESSGLILPLGRWVMETACKQLAAWGDRPETAHLSMAVNVSARQFKQSNFVQEMLAILASTGAKAQRLKLELTESVLVDNVDEIIGKMTELKEKGIGFSLDDFGTGYSSLSYLKRLPLYQLKISQDFVRDILVDPDDAAIAKMVVALTESIGLNVIAEGVETEAQRAFLADLGCHSYQGYLISKPLPIEEFEAFLQRGKKHSPA